MLNLAEYRQRPALLADWLPWAGLVAPGVVLNKDGSFQRTARFRGPDLDSATQGELIATSARLNNALRRLGSGWALFIEAERRVPDMEDMWLFLHLVFETIWEYRFLYRDLDNILSRNKKLRTHFRRILERKIHTAEVILRGLVEVGVMNATAADIAALARNIAVVATYWLNFQRIRTTPAADGADSDYLALGVYQVLALVAPFLNGDAQRLLRQLSLEYLS